jgi:hypothetical protein
MNMDSGLIRGGQTFIMVPMNREFHYYVICYLAHKAGFSSGDSETIAISSQMVDDAKLPWSIGGSPEAGVQKPGRSAKGLLTEVTQNYLFWDHDIARDVYLPFHFVPGDSRSVAARRSDKRVHELAVSQDSDNARSLLIEALRSGNLYRIGIALHAYADTWAHQNFTGTTDDFNAFGPNEPAPSMQFASSVLPAVGHLQAGRIPDLPQAIWEDPRLEAPYRTISNSARFLEAARMIYRFLSTSRRASFEDESFVLAPLEELWKKRRASRNDELAIASDYVIYFDVPAYDPDKWFMAMGAKEFSTSEMLKAVSTEGFTNEWRSAPYRKAMTRGSISAARYRDSPFEQWNRAALAHRKAFADLMHRKGIRIV